MISTNNRLDRVVSLSNLPFSKPGKPSTPKNLRVKEVNKDYVILTWEAPDSDGGSPITGYSVEKKDVTKKSFIKAETVDGSTFETKVSKLVEGKEYEFLLYAENAIGVSSPAKLGEPVKARLPFGEHPGIRMRLIPTQRDSY